MLSDLTAAVAILNVASSTVLVMELRMPPGLVDCVKDDAWLGKSSMLFTADLEVSLIIL